ncbi:MAG: hypothetical protein M1476_00325 [Candidatus Thermoplasmatota archaeon]|nr:hypothetical protein [Candidatus Thermoplasmatota archaeon]
MTAKEVLNLLRTFKRFSVIIVREPVSATKSPTRTRAESGDDQRSYVVWALSL